MPSDGAEALSQLQLRTFDDALGRRIVDTHIWAVREGLRGADAYHLFDGYCQRLVIDAVPLWRAQAAMETLHPQWNGYGYTWRRDLNAIEPENYAHTAENDRLLYSSPFYALMQRGRAGESSPSLRRRIANSPSERDFPILEEFHARGVTDYLAQLFVYGDMGDRSQGTGIAYSFATDRKGGFSDDDTTLDAGDLARPVAGDEGACRPSHRLGAADDLSRRGRGTAGPRRLDHARFGRQSARGDLVRRHPRLHGR